MVLGQSLRLRTIEPNCGNPRAIPYGRQWIDEMDIQAVEDVLRSDWLTTGPKVEEFEKAVADFVGAKYAVAISSGTAAIHAAMFALGVGPGDEVIVPPITFVATANAVVFQSGTPVFADVKADTLLLNPEKVQEKITVRTKAIIGVDYAGQPCDWDKLRKIADHNNIALVADACHAFGARYKDRKVGTLGDMTVFSFHPVKHITTGEGGMIVTENRHLAGKMRKFRNHGIDSDHAQREKRGTWYYEMTDLGYNYRMTDFQCALGLSQLQKLPTFLARRREIAEVYDRAFASVEGVEPIKNPPDTSNSYHLYVVRVKDRDRLFTQLRERGIGVNVHYFPVHLQPYYREHFRTGQGLCPVAEEVYHRILSLPMFPQLTDEEVEYVVSSIKEAIN